MDTIKSTKHSQPSKGWVKLHRSIETWDWADCPLVGWTFIRLLLKANIADRHYRGELIRRGECIISYAKFAAEIGMSIQCIRTALNRLKSTREITCRATRHFTVVTIVNFDSYQDIPGEANTPTNTPTNTQLTRSQHAANTQLTTPKELRIKKEELRSDIQKKPPPLFDPTGKTKFLDWVYLSDEQYKRVVKYYEGKGLGPDEFNEAVRELDAWFSNNPKMRAKRTDDGKALIGWPLDRALQRKRELMQTALTEKRYNGDN